MINKIITLMNYPDLPHYNLMCKLWIHFSQINLKDKNIEIYTSNNLSPIVETYARKFKNISIKKVSCYKMTQKERNIANTNIYLIGNDLRNLTIKAYGIFCNIPAPYIFIDADAFVVGNIDMLCNITQSVAVTEDMPLCKNHNYKGCINTGVVVVNKNVFD